MSNETKEVKAEVIKESTPNAQLVSILRTKRAHGSAGDTNFRLWLAAELTKLGHKPTFLAEGCMLVRTDVKSDTLFSCHVDTVHSNTESDGSFQNLMYDATFNQIFLAKESKSGCLGADDGAGIYIMLRMIAAKVPGSYIFHTGEERGGIGSNAVRQKHKELLEDFNRAIAFDRKCAVGDAPEVIVTQGGTSCASIDMGKALVEELNKFQGFAQPWVVSHGGTFTDTKNYCGIIPECLNVSCFYEQAHSPAESLDVASLELLVEACCKIKWDEFKTHRKPVVYTPPVKSNKGFNNAMRDMYADDMYGGDMYGNAFRSQAPKFVQPKQKVTPIKKQEPAMTILEEMDGYSSDDFYAFVEGDADMAAKVLAYLFMQNKSLQSKADFIEAYLDVS